MVTQQLTLLDHAITELTKIQALAVGQTALLPLPITTKAAEQHGIPRSAMRKAKQQGQLDYTLPHGQGRVKVEFVGQAKRTDFWRIWKYEGGEVIV